MKLLVPVGAVLLTVILCGCASAPTATNTGGYVASAQSFVGIEMLNTSPVFIEGVIPKSPADLAGIREGDYVLAVDGRTGQKNVIQYIASLAPDSSISITYARDHVQHLVTVRTADPLRLFTELQTQGNPAGPTGLAQLELSGYPMPKGTPPAEDILNRAVTQGYPEAMDILGSKYLSSSDQQTQAHGLELLTRASQQNYLDADDALMRHYFQEKDWVAFAKLAQKADVLDTPFGKFNLALLYMYGKGGIEEDHKKGMALFQVTADGGYGPGMFALGREYASGQHIHKDIPRGYLWFTLAGKFGQSNAQKFIAYLNEKSSLDDAQKDRLATRVDSWMQYLQRTSDPESPGNVALSEGNLYAALQDDVNALQSLPDPAPVDVDKRLRTQVITIVHQLGAPPALPAAATQYEIYGKTAAQSATDPDGLLNAIENLHKATNVAPWWADGYYNLAVVEEQAKDYADAARSLGYYLLANPHATDANEVQSRIYSLQYKAYNP